MAPKMAKEIQEAAIQSESRLDSTHQAVPIPTPEEIAKLAYSRWEARAATT